MLTLILSSAFAKTIAILDLNQQGYLSAYDSQVRMAIEEQEHGDIRILPQKETRHSLQFFKAQTQCSQLSCALKAGTLLKQDFIVYGKSNPKKQTLVIA